MTEFDGRLRVLGESGFPLGVEVDLSRDRMTVSSGGEQIADWSLAEIRITPTASGFRIAAEGEEVILNVTDSQGFIDAIGNHLIEL